MAIINEKKPNLSSYGVSTSGITVAGSTKSYSTIADRDADMHPGTFAYVRDASADPTVKSGFALYVRKNGGWQKIFEEEAMDQDIAELITINWENVLNKPESSVEAIDDAVAKAHEHDNKEALDKIGAAEDHLTYNGETIKAEPVRYTKWLQLIRPTISAVALDCKIELFDDPNLATLLDTVNSTVDLDRFRYYNGAFFSLVTSDGIPVISSGRFVIVDIQDIIAGKSVFIRWTWYKHGTEDVVSSGLCVYPSITPTNTESVGLVWGEV